MNFELFLKQTEDESFAFPSTGATWSITMTEAGADALLALVALLAIDMLPVSNNITCHTSVTFSTLTTKGSVCRGSGNSVT